MRIGISKGGLQGAELIDACSDIAGIELVVADTQDELEERALDCEALMLNSARYSARLAERLASGASPVRWLQFASAGYETVLEHGLSDHVLLTNGGSAWGPTVAEHAMALILGLLRAVPLMERERLRARWDASHVIPHLRSLEGMKVGIVGAGDIGRGIAARLRPFGAEVIGVVRSPRPLEHVDHVCILDQICSVLPELDILVLALPLNDETRGMANASWFHIMKPSSLLINVGRGGLIDQSALIDALRNNAIGGAGLDVAIDEPLCPSSPLWLQDNVILTPHIAALGGRSLDRLIELCKENIMRFRDGLPLRNRVLVPSQRNGSVRAVDL